jgi:hypothetical protein
METATQSSLLDNLVNMAREYTRVIETPFLEKCPYIVQVGELTVSTDETGKTQLVNTQFPMQFSKIAVKQILGIEFKNSRGEKILPRVYTKREWYTERLEGINQTINLLNGNN